MAFEHNHTEKRGAEDGAAGYPDFSYKDKRKLCLKEDNSKNKEAFFLNLVILIAITPANIESLSLTDPKLSTKTLEAIIEYACTISNEPKKYLDIMSPNIKSSLNEKLGFNVIKLINKERIYKPNEQDLAISKDILKLKQEKDEVEFTSNINAALTRDANHVSTIIADLEAEDEAYISTIANLIARDPRNINYLNNFQPRLDSKISTDIITKACEISPVLKYCNNNICTGITQIKLYSSQLPKDQKEKLDKNLGFDVVNLIKEKSAPDKQLTEVSLPIYNEYCTGKSWVGYVQITVSNS